MSLVFTVTRCSLFLIWLAIMAWVRIALMARTAAAAATYATIAPSTARLQQV